MPLLSMIAADDAMFQTPLKDAYVGAARVMPAEIDALLDRLEGWLENASLRRAEMRAH